MHQLPLFLFFPFLFLFVTIIIIRNNRWRRKKECRHQTLKMPRKRKVNIKETEKEGERLQRSMETFGRRDEAYSLLHFL